MKGGEEVIVDISFEREPARIPISLRLPAEVVREVEAFAKRKNIRKTDAYLYFLRLGLANEQAQSSAAEAEAPAKSPVRHESSTPPRLFEPGDPTCASGRFSDRTHEYPASPVIAALDEKLNRILALLQGQQAATPATTGDSTPGKQQRPHTATSDRAKERDAICEVIQQTSGLFPAITRAYLFGSIARDTFSDESDIDIRVEIDPERSFNLHDLVHYAKYIEQQSGRQADVISARVIRNEALARAIEREGVLVYER